jgi:hypothetical protein
LAPYPIRDRRGGIPSDCQEWRRYRELEFH